MPDTLYRSHKLEKSTSDGQVITSGSITTWEDEPVSPFDVGDIFRPVPDGPPLTVKHVSINDNVIGTVAGKTVRQWQISVEGDNSSDDSSTNERHNFSIELDEDDNVTHSGSILLTKEGSNPPANISVGANIHIPGIGNIKCTKITGSDDYKDDGTRVWTMTYEGTDADSEEAQQGENLPKAKYSFSIDSEHSGSMQVVNEGNSPAITLAVGAKFDIPGVGNVTCTKISGSDDYTDSGKRRWTVTYEGSANNPQTENNTKYTFTLEDNAISGTKQVLSYGGSPNFAHAVGDTFNIPGAGNVKCSKVNGSDEFTDDGRHKWTVTYEGANASDEEAQQQEETLPNDKYSISIEENSDGETVKSGSKIVVNEGDNPILIKVGDTFNIPGIGDVTCSKVTGSDDYTESGQRRWTMTYEGYVKETSQGGDDTQDQGDQNTKYHFSIEKDSNGNQVHSGSIEITAQSSDIAYQVGQTINIPGIGNVTCVKVSGSDSYTDSGQRKWIMVYEGSDSKDNSSGSSQQSAQVKYSYDIEKNSDGITVYSGTKEFSSSEDNASPGIAIGETFICGYAGTLTCTKIRASKDSAGVWTFVIEGSRGGAQSSEQQDSTSLPDDEESVSYELNGSTVYTIAGEFIALRRSSSPIRKKSITVYNNSDSPVATMGSAYGGGIALSENIIKETIKKDNVVIRTYYKHTIEVEGETTGGNE